MISTYFGVFESGMVSKEMDLIMSSRDDLIREVFSLFDADKNGEIDMEELKEVMTRLGIEPSEEDLAKMIAVVDKNENGAVDFVEFLEMMKGRENDDNN